MDFRLIKQKYNSKNKNNNNTQQKQLKYYLGKTKKNSLF